MIKRFIDDIMCRTNPKRNHLIKDIQAVSSPYRVLPRFHEHI